MKKKTKKKIVKAWMALSVEREPLFITLSKPQKCLLEIDKQLRRLSGGGFYHQITIQIPSPPKRKKGV